VHQRDAQYFLAFGELPDPEPLFPHADVRNRAARDARGLVALLFLAARALRRAQAVLHWRDRTSSRGSTACGASGGA
jgi:hypothetical protein